MANREHITAEELRQILHYDPETGIFTWAKPRPKIRVGNQAGYIDKKGYRYTEIDGKGYFIHRLAWLYMTGTWPGGQIDHMPNRPY